MPSVPPVATLSVLVWLSLLPGEARSQEPIWKSFGDSSQDFFGVSVSGAGDVNADGIPDVIVGASNNDVGGPNAGMARVLSGLDGSTLYSFFGASGPGGFGRTARGAGDVNLDGYADLIVGAWIEDDNGSARVYSGQDGSELYAFFGDPSTRDFGFSVDGIGDVDLDGHSDFIIGASFSDLGGSLSGSIWVHSGADGSVLHQLNGEAGDLFGFSTSGAGDVDRDGVPDFVVGAIFTSVGGSQTGSVQVFSGADGTLLHRFDGDEPEDQLGYSVSGAGDVDHDGFADIIAGAPFSDGPLGAGDRMGMARVYSGRLGVPLYTFHGVENGGQLGFHVRGVGDPNSDGFGDVMAGARVETGSAGSRAGVARLYSGRNGTVLYAFEGANAGDLFGVDVSGVGDVDGDGLDDLVVGALLEADSTGAPTGSAEVYRGNDLYLNASPRRVTAGQQLSLTTREGSPGDPTALFVADLDGTPFPWLLDLSVFGADGGRTYSAIVPPGLGGLRIGLLAFTCRQPGIHRGVLDSAIEIVTLQ